MPTKTATLEDYGRRIARAMARLAAAPDQPPSLEELADAAAFSPYHFHRIYRLLAGETPAETLARTRLSRAAVDLLAGMPTTAVARRAGYGSVAAFTRAFRAAYGIPPASYRARGGIGTRPRPSPRTEEIAMFDITIRREPAMRLAVLRHTGPYTEIGHAFGRIGAWAAARNLVGPDTRFRGLYWDDPQTVPAAKLRAAAGVTVGPEVAASDGVEIIEIPALRVAALRFKGPYAELEGAYTALYRDWLPTSGEEPADHPAMEEYVNDCRTLPPSEWLTDILVPLKD